MHLLEDFFVVSMDLTDKIGSSKKSKKKTKNTKKKKKDEKILILKKKLQENYETLQSTAHGKDCKFILFTLVSECRKIN